MDNMIVLGNGFDIDLGLKTSFKRFVESFEFLSIPDIPLIKKIKERSVENWYDLEGLLRNELITRVRDKKVFVKVGNLNNF